MIVVDSELTFPDLIDFPFSKISYFVDLLSFGIVAFIEYFPSLLSDVDEVILAFFGSSWLDGGVISCPL